MASVQFFDACHCAGVDDFHFRSAGLVDEELHADEVNKMLRRPGETGAFQF